MISKSKETLVDVGIDNYEVKGFREQSLHFTFLEIGLTDN
jgi:hypothetical protein